MRARKEIWYIYSYYQVQILHPTVRKNCRFFKATTSLIFYCGLKQTHNSWENQIAAKQCSSDQKCFYINIFHKSNNRWKRQKCFFLLVLGSIVKKILKCFWMKIEMLVVTNGERIEFQEWCWKINTKSSQNYIPTLYIYNLFQRNIELRKTRNLDA